MRPLKIPMSKSLETECYLVICKGTFDVITLMILRWGDCPGLSGWPLSEILSVFLGRWQDGI